MFEKLHMVALRCLTLSLFAAEAQAQQYFTTVAAASTNAFPLATLTSRRTQWLYTPTELNALPIAGFITKVYFKTPTAAAAGSTLTNFRIGLATTGISTFVSGPWYATTTVLQSPSQTIPGPIAANQMVGITLATPFFYDGVSNLIFDMQQAGYTTALSTSQATIAGSNRRMHGDWTNAASSGADGTQVGFGFDMVPAGPDNAGANAVTDPVNFCPGTHPVMVRIKNNGTNTISNVTVNWMLDGVLQPPVSWSTPIPPVANTPANQAVVTLGSVAFSATAPRTIKAWTSAPNNTADSYNGDDTVSATLHSALTGIYTIGGAAPDYTSIALAAQDLSSFGVCGPVTLNIRSGTYTNDRAALINIFGVSAVNRITFQSESGNAANVVFNTNSASAAVNFIFGLAGTSYVTIKNLTLNPTNATFGKAISITAGSGYDSVLNCAVNLVAAATVSAERAGIFNAGVNTGNVIKGNTVTNASFGIYQNGDSPTALAPGSIIDSNTIVNAYSDGIYSFHTLNLKMRNNQVSRAAAAGTAYGIRCFYSDGSHELSGNKVSIVGASGTAYGISQQFCDAVGSDYPLSRNNVIYVAGSGALYGYETRNSVSSVHLNNTSVTAGTGATCYAGYILHNSATFPNNVISNNIFWNSGTTGVVLYNNHPLYGLSDYNNVFGGASLFQRGSAPAITTNSLSAYRLNTGSELNSICYRPGLMSPANPVPNPADTAVWSIHGRGVQHPSNGTDINGAARPTTLTAGVPDLGAYEFVPASVPPMAIAAPAAAAPGASQVFTFGQDTVAVLQWGAASAVPANLVVRVQSGIVPGGLPPGSFMYYYTDVTASGPGLNYQASSYYKDPWKGTSPVNESAIRMASKNGTAPWTSYPGTASTIDAARNILTVGSMSGDNWYTGRTDSCSGTPAAVVITNVPMTGVLCSGQNVTLNADDPNTTAGIVYRWQSAPAPSGPWTTIPAATQLAYTSGPLSDTIYFRVADTCTASGQSAVGNVYMVPVVNPQITAVVNGTRCGPGVIQLQATGSAGTVISWYNTPAGGTALGTGTAWTTPLQAGGAMTYYAQASIGACVSARLAVTATVNPSTPFSITDTQSVCNNGIAVLSVLSAAASYDQVTWSPIANLYTDAAATVPYVANANAGTVYARTAAAGFASYVATGLNTASSCQGMDTAAVFTQPEVTQLAASPDTLCTSGAATLSLVPATPYFPGSIRWSSSPKPGNNYTLINAATAATYTTPVITDTTFYRIESRNSAGAVCQTLSRPVIVKIPTITGVTPAARCGPGTLALGASVLPGYGINWYASPTSGVPVGSGGSFITPFLLTTTTYYVSAGNGNGGSGSLQASPTGGNGCGGGAMFNITPTTSLTIDSFKGRVNTAGSQVVNVYYKTGTYVGFETTPAAWTLAGTTTINAATTNTVLNIPVGIPVPLAAGTTYGVYLNYNAGYLTGAQTYTNTDMTLVAGAGLCSAFGGLNAARSFSGTVHYRKGCESSRTPVVATVNPAPAVSISPGDTVNVCFGSVANLVASSSNAGYAYTWQPVQVQNDTLSLQASTTSAYRLYAIDTSIGPFAGCAYYDTVLVNVKPMPAADVIPDGATRFCAGDSVRLTTPAGTSYTYQWLKSAVPMPGKTGTAVTVTLPGSYAVQVTLGQCTKVSDIELVTVNPLPQPVVTASGAMLSTGSFDSYQWMRNGILVLGATGQSYLPAQNGDYSVAVTDANGCTNSSGLFRLSNLGISVNNAQASVVKILPNPVRDVLRIEAPMTVRAVLSSSDGKTVIRQDDAQLIDVRSLADGVYFIRVYDARDNSILVTERLVKSAQR